MPPPRRGPTTTTRSWTSCWDRKNSIIDNHLASRSRVLLLVLTLTVERVGLLGQTREVEALLLLLLLLLLRERLLLHRELRVDSAGWEEPHLLLRRTLVERVH